MRLLFISVLLFSIAGCSTFVHPTESVGENKYSILVTGSALSSESDAYKAALTAGTKYCERRDKKFQFIDSTNSPKITGGAVLGTGITTTYAQSKITFSCE
jgi:hypothetical protein